MSQKLSPAFVELTHNALLKAFWSKPSLRGGLAQHKISENALAQWHSEQTKRESILWLWPQLIKTEKGQNAVCVRFGLQPAPTHHNHS